MTISAETENPPGLDPRSVAGESAPSDRAARAFVRFWPLFVVVAPATALTVVYIARTFVNLIYLDAFIQVPYVGNFLGGGSFISALFTAPWAGEHLLLGYRLWSLVNGKVFGLNLELDPVAFLVASVATAIIVYLECQRVFRTDRRWKLLILYFPLGALCFSLVSPPGMNMTTEFVWGVTLALFIAFLLQRDWSYSAQRRFILSWPYVAALIFIPIYFIFLSGAYFPGFVVGLGLMCLFRAVIERRWADSKVYVIFAVALASSAAYLYFLLTVQTPVSGEASGGIHVLLSNPWHTLLLYFAALTGGILDNPTISSLSPSTVAELGAGMAVILLGALWLFVRTKMYRQTYLPIFCIFYTFGAATSVYAGRQQVSGWEGVTQEWYPYHLRPAAIGIAWILVYSLHHLIGERATWSARRWSLQSSSVVFVVLALTYVAVPQVISNVRQWDRSPAVKQYLGGLQNALLYPNFYPGSTAANILLWPAPQVAQDRQILVHDHLTQFGDKSLRGIDFDTVGTPTKRVDWFPGDWVGPRARAVVVSPSYAVMTLTFGLPSGLRSNDVEVIVDGRIVFDNRVLAGDRPHVAIQLSGESNTIRVIATKTAGVSIRGHARRIAVHIEVSVEF